MALSQITWQDVQQLPDDGHRHEAIEGELYVTPAPSFRHQRISQQLERALVELLEKPEHGIVVHAPIGVEFPSTGEGVQPDIVFISTARRAIITEPDIQGAPDLVIEILSPTTAHRDRGIKRKLYERQGVGQYWIVDPEAEVVEVWTFGGESGTGAAREPSVERFRGNVSVRLEGQTVGEVELAQVFKAD